jgi:hypothetical protein
MGCAGSTPQANPAGTTAAPAEGQPNAAPVQAGGAGGGAGGVHPVAAPAPDAISSRVDPATGKTYWVNHTTKMTYWTEAEATGAAPPVLMSVTVPDGMQAGQMLMIITPADTQMQVQIPAGVSPGQAFQVQAPAAAAAAAAAAALHSTAPLFFSAHSSRWQCHCCLGCAVSMHLRPSPSLLSSLFSLLYLCLSAHLSQMMTMA